MKNQPNTHIILSCHQIDVKIMENILAGMETHSDFVTFPMNELWLGDFESPAKEKPIVDAWHGFIWPGFPMTTLAGLLVSGEWKVETCLRILVCEQDDWKNYSLMAFCDAVGKGHFGKEPS